MPYIGTSPGTGTRSRYLYTATASQTTFSGADDNSKTLSYADGDYVDVYLNGVSLVPVTDYTATSKTSIVLTAPAGAGDVLEIVAYDIATIADTVSKANGGTFEGDVALTNASPDLTLKNNTPEDTDGGRESTITFRGLQSGGEESTLAQIQASHDGSADDEKGDLIFSTNDGSDGSTPTEAMRIDADGHVIVGGYGTTDRPDTMLEIRNDNDSGAGPVLALHNQSGAASGARSAIHFGRTNTPSRSSAIINTAGSFGQYNDLSFEVNGSEVMRIDDSGRFLVGMTAASVDTPGFYVDFTGTIVACRSASDVAIFNRQTNDGTIILFRQGTSNEGTISVSGSTVSYNGGHLARWSQTADNTRITGLLKGTVLTNLDQMAVWDHEAVAATYYVEGDKIPEGMEVGDEKTPAAEAFTEDNEQLNCMAVSSVEGDPNVSGVFVNWDDDDETYTADMNVAMTGDMVIRIAQGTTVQRGDLLMSAGDGTAKPQGDDIVRSKTIAKVTSTYVSNTYDDGSYCVPCVLMAC